MANKPFPTDEQGLPAGLADLERRIEGLPGEVDLTAAPPPELDELAGAASHASALLLKHYGGDNFPQLLEETIGDRRIAGLSRYLVLASTDQLPEALVSLGDRELVEARVTAAEALLRSAQNLHPGVPYLVGYNDDRYYGGKAQDQPSKLTAAEHLGSLILRLPFSERFGPPFSKGEMSLARAAVRINEPPPAPPTILTLNLVTGAEAVKSAIDDRITQIQASPGSLKSLSALINIIETAQACDTNLSNCSSPETVAWAEQTLFGHFKEYSKGRFIDVAAALFGLGGGEYTQDMVARAEQTILNQLPSGEQLATMKAWSLNQLCEEVAARLTILAKVQTGDTRSTLKLAPEAKSASEWLRTMSKIITHLNLQ